MDHRPGVLYAINPKGSEPGLIYDPLDDSILLKVAHEHLAAVVESGEAFKTLGTEVFLPIESYAPIAGLGEIEIAAVRALARAHFAGSVH